MRFSKTKHFWKWFQTNLDAYNELYKKPKTQMRYHLYELFAHLRSCGQGLHAEFHWNYPVDGAHTMTITTYGKRRHFAKVDRLVAEAPAIPGWTIEALMPPRTVDYFMEEDFGYLNIDPFDYWFVKPTRGEFNDRICLNLYANVLSGYNDLFNQAAAAAVFNVLGERTYGHSIVEVQLWPILELSQKEKARLINLQQLPQYINNQEKSSLIINENGMIIQEK